MTDQFGSLDEADFVLDGIALRRSPKLTHLYSPKVSQAF
jgi:hypothetical protein